jgi:L-lactate utilization protein LutB
LAPLANHHYTKAVSAERVEAAKVGLEKSGFKVHVVENRGEAFNPIKNLIPAGASVNNAHSTSLEEIGFVTYLKGQT